MPTKQDVIGFDHTRPNPTVQELEKLAKGLTKAQREWIASMPDEPKALTTAEYEALPDKLYVQFSPDEYCPETGCFLGGGQMHWFGRSSARYLGDGGPWRFEASLNETGLALRDHIGG